MDDIERAEERVGRGPEALGRCRAAPSATDCEERAGTPSTLVTVGAADGITIQDARGALVYANLAAARLSGYGVGRGVHRPPIRGSASLTGRS